jgi:hypothetical protein
MSDFCYKQGDTLPEIQATLKDADGVAVDLTGAAVMFHLRRWASTEVLIEEEAEIVSPATSGVVKYTLTEDDIALLTYGLHPMEFEVTFSDESVLTFPNDSHLTLMVKGEIA